MTRKRVIVSLATLALIASAALAAWTYLRPIFGLGTVEARVESKIGFKVSGILVDLEADVGDRVVKGAVLALLDSREQQVQVERAKASIILAVVTRARAARADSSEL